MNNLSLQTEKVPEGISNRKTLVANGSGLVADSEGELREREEEEDTKHQVVSS